jgi:hypothetical protein
MPAPVTRQRLCPRQRRRISRRLRRPRRPKPGSDIQHQRRHPQQPSHKQDRKHSRLPPLPPNQTTEPTLRNGHSNTPWRPPTDRQLQLTSSPHPPKSTSPTRVNSEEGQSLPGCPPALPSFVLFSGGEGRRLPGGRQLELVRIACLVPHGFRAADGDSVLSDSTGAGRLAGRAVRCSAATGRAGLHDDRESRRFLRHR